MHLIKSEWLYTYSAVLRREKVNTSCTDIYSLILYYRPFVYKIVKEMGRKYFKSMVFYQ